MDSTILASEHAGRSVSSWMATAELPTFQPLTAHEQADVCIVGAGIAGLTTAYLLTKAGKSVIVLDDGPIVSGESERTTAHLTIALDSRIFELEWLHGEQGAKLIVESHNAAIDQIEKIVQAENIQCDFERIDGYLFMPPGETPDDLEKEREAGNRFGLNLEMIASAPIESFDTGPALRFPNQAQFHPLKYLAALAQAIIRDGGKIFTHTHATEIEGGEPATVKTEDGQLIISKSVVVATNTPINDLITMHTKQAAYRNFVIGAAVPTGSVQKGLYWDTLDPYHYVRLQPSDNGDILIIGGEDAKTGQTHDAEDRYKFLEEWARERFPMITEIRFKWSGQTMQAIDGIGFIGRNPGDKPNVYIATGFGGNGMTHGTISALLITDLITEKPNPWESLYDPARANLRAAGNFAKDAINMIVQYGEWLTPGDLGDVEKLAPGTRAIVRKGFTKIAAYRDEAGELHECSAVCPHLGAILAWNHSEQTWDCPCHGSRFDRFGTVLNGPANTNLPPVEEDK